VLCFWRRRGLNFIKAANIKFAAVKLKNADKAALWFKFICADWLVFRAKPALNLLQILRNPKPSNKK